MNLKTHLEGLSKTKGYLGSGVFTGSGELLEGTSMISGIHQELAGAAINDTLLQAQEMTKDVGMGHADFLQIDTDMGMVLTRCYNVGTTHFHTVLYLKKDGNVAMGKLLMKKSIEGLATEF